MKRTIDILEILADEGCLPAHIIDKLLADNRNWELEVDYIISVTDVGKPGDREHPAEGPSYRCYPTPDEVSDMAVRLAGNIYDTLDFYSEEKLRNEVYRQEVLHRESSEFDSAVLLDIADGACMGGYTE